MNTKSALTSKYIVIYFWPKCENYWWWPRFIAATKSTGRHQLVRFKVLNYQPLLFKAKSSNDFFPTRDATYPFTLPKFLQALRILLTPRDWNEHTSWDCVIRKHLMRDGLDLWLTVQRVQAFLNSDDPFLQLFLFCDLIWFMIDSFTGSHKRGVRYKS